VAIDPKAPPESELASPIENEIPTYRAISPAAVFSLCLGLLSGLSFVDEVYLLGLLAAVAAVVTGAYAEYQMRRQPDALTGRGFAQAGIALGLICGLSSQTIGLVTTKLTQREAAAFAREYADKLASKDAIAYSVYYQVPPTPRKEMTPQEALEKRSKGGREASMFESEIMPIRGIVARLEKGAHLEFNEIEGVVYDKLTPMAAATLRLHGPAEEGHPAEEFVLVELKADPEGRRGAGRWYVADVRYPYKPKTYVAPVQPVDDGHGHGGHGH
jgi:hypothetical protein